MAIKVVPSYINLDNIKQKPKNRVTSIGIEVEGGWKQVPKGVEVERDTSVFKVGEQGGRSIQEPPEPVLAFGEIPLGPMAVVQIPTSMRKYYPQVVDKTCGLHVHLGFRNNLHYSMLMVPEYQATIVEYVTRWATKEGLLPDNPIWERLAGKSMYCQNKFWPDDQVIMGQKDYDKKRKGHRYTLINFCHKRKGTIEVRVLPMMKEVDQGIRAVKLLVDITNKCLARLSGRFSQSEQAMIAIDPESEFIEVFV